MSVRTWASLLGLSLVTAAAGFLSPAAARQCVAPGGRHVAAVPPCLRADARGCHVESSGGEVGGGCMCPLL